MEEKNEVVRNQKDTVFRMLFRDKKELLELYNALNGSAYQNPEELSVYTLENAIYMNVKNDISFLLDSELNLYEHQASYNPNMPLRDLIYIARQLGKYIRESSIYSTVLTRIPVPRFVVFYNGTKKQPERKILKLSDAFEKKVSDPELELKVLMLNINLGQNQQLMEKCKTLKEYCQYVEHVRKYAKEMPVAEAVDRAVTECIREGILAEFLSAQRAEVVAMSIFEYNEEEELKKLRKSEFAGGKAEGKIEGKQEDILALLEELGTVPDELHNRILRQKDTALLRMWLKEAAKAISVEQFLEHTKILG